MALRAGPAADGGYVSSHQQGAHQQCQRPQTR